MQRIDENTYIDDTLVTCAEYQLFIDEMREQGKYYQPDHWASFQFPEGQAREPILGVRQSDTVTFCEWLSQQQGGEWKFRLPNSEEANAFGVKKFVEGKPFGYWVINDINFIWENAVSENKIVDASNFDQSYIFFKDLHYGLNPSLGQAQDRTYDLARDLARAYVPNCPLDLDRTRDNVHTLDIEIKHALKLDSEVTNKNTFALVRARNLKSASDCIYALTIALDRATTIDCTQGFSLARSLVLDLTEDHVHDLTPTLYIYIDLFTLQERIAGRSPAFEGIRLVKERTR